MRALFVFFLLVFPLLSFASNQKTFIKEFNGYAEKNINGGNQPSYLDMTCGTVGEDLVFSRGSDGNMQLFLEVDSDKTGHVTYRSSGYGVETADDNFDKEIGWQYLFAAPNGQIAVILLDSGVAYTQVSVLHGEGYRRTRSKCKINNIINGDA